MFDRQELNRIALQTGPTVRQVTLEVLARHGLVRAELLTTTPPSASVVVLRQH